MDDLDGKCFRCANCGTEFDQSPALDACRICKQNNCRDCMSADGVCVPCSQLKR